jgi:hypothetical protein
MATGWIAGILRGRESDVAEPLAVIGDVLIRRAAIGWASKEAVIVITVSAALIIVGRLGARLIDPELSVVVACIILLLYFLHVAMYLPSLMRAAWIAWQLRLPIRRLGLFFLYRAIIRSMERVEHAAEEVLENENWYVRGGFGLVKWLKSGPRDKAAWRIAEATAPLMWRYAIRTTALCVTPLFLVITTFRMTVTQGILLNEATHLGVLEAIVYPFAALADLTFGTSLREMLKHG